MTPQERKDFERKFEQKTLQEQSDVLVSLLSLLRDMQASNDPMEERLQAIVHGIADDDVLDMEVWGELFDDGGNE